MNMYKINAIKRNSSTFYSEAATSQGSWRYNSVSIAKTNSTRTLYNGSALETEIFRVFGST